MQCSVQGSAVELQPPSTPTDGVVRKCPSVVFIDRLTFSNTLSNVKDFKIQDFVTLNEGWTDLDYSQQQAMYKSCAAKVSERLRWFIQYVHRRTSFIVSGDNSYMHDSLARPHSESVDGVLLKESFEMRLLGQDSARDDSFYEILPVGDGVILVVMENGFLHHLTQSKNSASALVLNCLGALDRFKSDLSVLNKLYLNLAFIENYHLLMKARLG